MKISAILGDNINYTLSPFLYEKLNRIIRFNNYYYVKYSIPNIYLYDLIILLVKNVIIVINITIPYKFIVYDLINFCSFNVKFSRRCNHVMYLKYTGVGYSSDGIGFIKNIKIMLKIRILRLFLFGCGSTLFSIFNYFCHFLYKSSYIILNRTLLNLRNILYFNDIILLSSSNYIKNYENEYAYLCSFVPSKVFYVKINKLLSLCNNFYIYNISYNLFIYNIFLNKKYIFLINGEEMLYLQAIENLKIILLASKIII